MTDLVRKLLEPPPAFTWVPSSNNDDTGYMVEFLVNPLGARVAVLEDFGYAAYPCAINCQTGNLERGGAYSDRVQAVLWAERVAGVHPAKPGDERPAFYYEAKKP